MIWKKQVNQESCGGWLDREEIKTGWNYAGRRVINVWGQLLGTFEANTPPVSLSRTAEKSRSL